jgi:molybdopterin-guanine dinucleotide biosynthesis protein A
LSSKAVLAFRYFFWMRNVFQHPGFVRQTFSLRHLTPDIEALGQELFAAYCKIPSIEIWSVESINGILLQMHYYVKAGVMTKKDMQEVSAGLYQVLEHLQTQAAYGCKFLPGDNPHSKKENFQLFYSRMGVANNTVLATSEGKRKVYLNYEALSFIDTTDEAFGNKVYEQLQMNMRRSTLISRVSEKQRSIFFNILYAKLLRYETQNRKPAL